MNSVDFDRFQTYWNGPRWQLWSFVVGVLSVPLAILVAFLASQLLGERLVPLIMLILVLFILGASLVGSGFIDSLTSQLNRGGLARDASEHVEESLSRSERESREQRTKEMRDRRTIRAGLIVVAPLVAFIYFMTVV